MSYFLAGLIIIGLVYLWLTWTVKKTVVQPVKKGGVMIGPLLSEKPRWKVIKEDHGLAIGFWLGLFLALALALLVFGG